MKYLALSPIILGVLFFIGCGGEETADESIAANLQTETITVEGIQCQMCVATIQQAAGSVSGVERMNVDFDNKIATVSFNPDHTSLQYIERAIANAGYHANDTQRDEDAYAQLPDCCR